MNRTRIVMPVVVLLLLVPVFSIAGDQDLSPHLKPLAPFLGKTWKGTFSNSTAEKPMHDVSRWERALNGQAVRILHSVNNGEYGGETLIIWDPARKSLVYYYFTTAGFYTHGTMTYDDGKFTSYEEVTGNQNGITAVKATGEILPDGRMRSRARYLKNGQWVDGHEIIYQEDPTAEVRFH